MAWCRDMVCVVSATWRRHVGVSVVLEEKNPRHDADISNQASKFLCLFLHVAHLLEHGHRNRGPRIHGHGGDFCGLGGVIYGVCFWKMHAAGLRCDIRTFFLWKIIIFPNIFHSEKNKKKRINFVKSVSLFFSHDMCKNLRNSIKILRKRYTK